MDRLTHWAPAEWPLASSWREAVDGFLASVEGQRLAAFLRERIEAGATIYPPHPLRALELTPLEGVHAVVLGQDPYHGHGQAEGLAFSVAEGVRLPPSLRNIFKEMGCSPKSGSLVEWARHGVLLLNACLTVEEGQPASHAEKGWEALTDRLVQLVAASATPCVYLLWGAHAQAKALLIEATARQHGRDILILQANHPSPLSARRLPVPFLGCGHFTQAREWLADRGVQGVF
ncbi:uracil-DNA glycosylase [Ramlibacter sp. G-1-2-2]|uniref:Uracil-DNA glycosylase n=1 Tax=Ramlibacter agri TaxID=2728837 RepID=A0A848GU22_9BURK|nr:uracil-DNA glycosylase [Ramlibacter agri]NML42116.1 uracil-DNA glycosylase [Ramlibacter agri]